MLNHVFKLHGLPLAVISDCGPHFISQFWRVFSSFLGGFVSLSSGYQAMSNGQTERLNQELEKGIDRPSTTASVY